MFELSPCPDLDKLSRLVAGELPDAEIDPFEQHVLTCSVCAETLDALQSSDAFTLEVRTASAITPLRDEAAEELIEHLVRTLPALEKTSVQDAREQRAAVMRRNLVAQARLKNDESILALDQAVAELQTVDDDAARLVLLRYFGGLTLTEAADVLTLTSQATERLWAYAKAWLHRKTQGGLPPL